MKVAMKRATVYFDPKIHKALRIKAASTDRSLSDIVNEAVRIALTEDAEDLEAFDKRANEPNLLFEEVLQDLKNRGQI
jgi:plasmid stability protein